MEKASVAVVEQATGENGAAVMVINGSSVTYRLLRKGVEEGEGSRGRGGRGKGRLMLVFKDLEKLILIGRRAVWVKGEMDRRMDGRTDGWMDGQRDGRVDKCIDGRKDGWKNGWMGGRTDGRTDG